MEECCRWSVEGSGLEKRRKKAQTRFIIVFARYSCVGIHSAAGRPVLIGFWTISLGKRIWIHQVFKYMQGTQEHGCALYDDDGDAVGVDTVDKLLVQFMLQ